MTHHPSRARWLLFMACILWGISFPLVRAIALLQAQLFPLDDSWFITGITVTSRFAAAALLIALWLGKRLLPMTTLEWRQGLELGIYGGFALIFQTDGLAYTEASTSAFLTQCYCLILPLIAAWKSKRWPALHTWIATLCVMWGVGILAGIQWNAFRLGRGEIETLLCALFCTGQILALEKPQYHSNRPLHVTALMFATMALCALPVAVWHTQNTQHWKILLTSPGMLGLLAILTILCTIVAYLVMNAWQKHIPATQAGLIYSTEPAFTFLFALFLPQWFSTWLSIDYPNELFSMRILWGGGLITAANIIEIIGHRKAT